jgi:hypothetical protein
VQVEEGELADDAGARRVLDGENSGQIILDALQLGFGRRLFLQAVDLEENLFERRAGDGGCHVCDL